MLKNKSARQDRQCVPIDRFWIDRSHRDAKEIPDDAEKALLIHFARVQHLRRPRTAVHVLRELDRFLARLDAAREQKIDNGLADSLVHQWPAILAQIAPNAKVGDRDIALRRPRSAQRADPTYGKWSTRRTGTVRVPVTRIE